MANVLVIAPHPDDETLGCGGTLLRHVAAGDRVHWLIVTEGKPELGFDPAWLKTREAEIKRVAQNYGFSGVHKLGFATTLLDDVPARDLIGAIAEVVNEVQPQTLYLPYRGDVHGDHAAVFDAAMAATKWFRAPYIQEILAYETPSETEIALPVDFQVFTPNVFVDIANHLDAKIDLMNLFESEVGTFPFPRSEETLRALATWRGASVGLNAVEAFMSLREHA